MLLHFKDNIESDHKKQADELGPFTNRVAFYNILVAELGGQNQPMSTSKGKSRR